MSRSRYFGSALAWALLGCGGIALGQESAQEACKSEVIDTDACLDALEVTEQQTREQQEAAEEAAETAREAEQPAPDAGRPADALGADPASSAAGPNGADSAQAPPVADARQPAADPASPAAGAAPAQDPENGAPTASTTPAVDETEAMGLVGNDVKTRLEESVGEVTRVVKSRASSDLVAVAEIGGFLGFGVHTVALPIEETRIDAEGNLVTNLSREELELIPAFDPRDYTALQ